MRRLSYDEARYLRCYYRWLRAGGPVTKYRKDMGEWKPVTRGWPVLPRRRTV